MEMRNNGLDGLKALLGVSAAATPQSRQAQRGAVTSDLAQDQATVSNAGAEALQAAGDSGVRMEKVAAVQAALAAGSYGVAATDVAAKIIDSMLASNPASE